MTRLCGFASLILALGVPGWAPIASGSEHPAHQLQGGLRLDAPLQFTHYGGPEYQVEVGLLSRNIVFRTASAVLDAARWWAVADYDALLGSPGAADTTDEDVCYPDPAGEPGVLRGRGAAHPVPGPAGAVDADGFRRLQAQLARWDKQRRRR